MLYALQGSSRLGAKLGMHAKKYSFCYSMRDRSQEDPTLLLYMEQQRGEILKTSQKKSYTSSPRVSGENQRQLYYPGPQSSKNLELIRPEFELRKYLHYAGDIWKIPSNHITNRKLIRAI